MAAPAAAAIAQQPQFTDEQEDVIRRVLLGRESIYLQGNAGTGKSYTFHGLKRQAGQSAIQCVVGSTATTGIAGTHINGLTVYSYLGLGDGSKSAHEIAQRLMFAPYMKEQLDNCRLTRILVIDEISMLSALMLEKIDQVLRLVRKCNLPMGGMQFMPMGDFAQLPPVFKEGDDDRLAFESPVWKQMFPPRQCIRLTRIFRQKDQEFVALLDDLRNGALSDTPSKYKHFRTGLLSDASTATLVKLDRPLPVVHGVEPTTLFATRNEVESFNLARLEKLPGVAELHKAVDTVVSKDKFAFAPEKMDKLFMAPRTLPFKVGAQLMLLSNLDQAVGLVNGSRCTGTEAHGDDSVTVTFTNGRTLRVMPLAFEIKDRKGVVIAMRKQLPLTLAWACTIHKSQGMTLDYVSIDLSKGFAPGQVYTAISRARSLEGLQIRGGIPVGRLLVDERVRRYERGEPLVADQPKKTRKEHPDEEGIRTSPFFPPPVAAAAAAAAEPRKKQRQ